MVPDKWPVKEMLLLQPACRLSQVSEVKDVWLFVRVTDSADDEQCGGVPGIENRRLQFLGLLNCAYGACERPNLPAVQVSVLIRFLLDAGFCTTESQNVSAVELYAHLPSRCWSNRSPGQTLCRRSFRFSVPAL